MNQDVKKESQEIRREDTLRLESESIMAYIKNDIEELTKQEKDFIRLLREEKAVLLDRLQSLGLLPAFLEAENGTKPKH